VLSERDTENTSTLQKQKKKLTKIKDDLSRVVQKYHEFDARDKKKNEELSEDYRRITKQYKDLQAKFRHFELADNRKFEAVWSMHEEEVNQYLEQALKADQIINEQQLGWTWQSADLEIVRNPALMDPSKGGGDSGSGGNGGKYSLAEMQAVQAHQQQEAEEAEAAKVRAERSELSSGLSLTRLASPRAHLLALFPSHQPSPSLTLASLAGTRAGGQDPKHCVAHFGRGWLLARRRREEGD